MLVGVGVIVVEGTVIVVDIIAGVGVVVVEGTVIVVDIIAGVDVVVGGTISWNRITSNRH